MIATVGKGCKQPRPGNRSDPHPWVMSWPSWTPPLVQDRDGKILGKKVIQDNNLRRFMPDLFGRFPERQGRASMVLALGVGVDRCR